MKASKNTEQDSDDPETANEGDIHMEYSSGQFYSPSVGAVTKNDLKELGSMQVPSDNLKYLTI